MKKLRKLLSIMLTIAMVFTMTATVFAAGDGAPDSGAGTEQTEKKPGSIEIKNSETVSVSGRTFTAYQILTAEFAGEDASSGVVYRVPKDLVDFYASEFKLEQLKGKNGFDQAVAQAISNMNNDASELERFSKKVLNKVKELLNDENNKIFSKTVTAETNTEDKLVNSVLIDDLELGYYVVEDAGTATPVSALALTTTNTEIVTLKADQPKVDKYIDAKQDTDETNDTDTDGLVKNNNESIGDKVPYVVKSKVPDMTGYEKYYFIVNDTLSEGLTFNNDVEIVIRNEGQNESATPDDVDSMAIEGNNPPVTLDLVKDEDFTVTQNGQNIEIVFKNFINYRSITGADITITYSATINENAVVGNVDGNVNKVTLTYSNNPNTTDNGDPGNPDKPDPNNPNPPTGETPESTTRTFVTGIQLQKIDENNKALKGAEFKITGTKLNTVLVTKGEFTEDSNGLYWKLKDGTYTRTAPDTSDDPEKNTADKYESTTQKYVKVYTPFTTTFTEAEDGDYWKLKSGNYTTVEPTGETNSDYESTTIKYKETHQNAEKETVDITATVNDKGILVFEGLAAGTYVIHEVKAPNGYNLLKDDIEVTITCTFDKAGEILGIDNDKLTNCTWAATIKESADNKELVSTADGSTGIIKINVKNQSGSLLPSTGGIGTTIFYIVGGILVLGAAILLITKKRMSREA